MQKRGPCQRPDLEHVARCSTLIRRPQPHLSHLPSSPPTPATQNLRGPVVKPALVPRQSVQLPSGRIGLPWPLKLWQALGPVELMSAFPSRPGLGLRQSPEPRTSMESMPFQQRAFCSPRRLCRIASRSALGSPRCRERADAALRRRPAMAHATGLHLGVSRALLRFSVVPVQHATFSTPRPPSK